MNIKSKCKKKVFSYLNTASKGISANKIYSLTATKDVIIMNMSVQDKSAFLTASSL